MIEEEGVVIAIHARHARVRVQRRGACGACAAHGACGTSLLERFFGQRPIDLTAVNRVDAEVGDRVLVGVSEQGLLRAALAVYLVPILALLCGAMLGDVLGGGTHADVASLIGAFLGFTLALIWLRDYSVAAARNPSGQPVILRRLERHSILST